MAIITDNHQKMYSVWMVSREYDGLAGAGGVKDVCRQLAETLAGPGGRRVRVVLPMYGFMDADKLGFTPLQLPDDQPNERCPQGRRTVFDVDINYVGEDRRETVAIRRRKIRGVTVFLVESDLLSNQS